MLLQLGHREVYGSVSDSVVASENPVTCDLKVNYHQDDGL